MSDRNGTLPQHTATRYVVPLREGGSLPAILETEEGRAFVTKFRGAGQGARALVAEIIVGGIAQRAELPVPDIAIIHLDDRFGRTEKDPEIQDILRGSRGANVGLRYLPGAFNFDPVAMPAVDPLLASKVVWLDALTTNIDRTPRNPNLLDWQGKVWLIDHGAALYFHHDWSTVDEAKARSPFVAIKDHVLLAAAAELQQADEQLLEAVTAEAIREVLEMVPDELLMDAPAGIEPPFTTAEENREAYAVYFATRLAGDRPWLQAAIDARNERSREKREGVGYRR